VLSNERLELVDQLPVTVERRVGLEPLLQRGDAFLLQPGSGGHGEALGLQVGERRAAPESERLPQPLGGER
jgi:hypothetical protein